MGVLAGESASEQENERICDRLLGWTRAETIQGRAQWYHHGKYGTFTLPTPSFTDWATVGLILDAMQACMHRPDLLAELADKLAEGNLTPVEIRTAALECLRDSGEVGLGDSTP